MATAEELINNVYSEESEQHIVIGSDRYITVPDKLKRIAVQYDHNIETVTFDCPRFWDGHDMSQMKIYINYKNGNAKGAYLAQNVTVEENIMHFDWTISINVTQYKGPVMFLVCAKKTDGNGEELIHWNSELNTEMYVSEGMETIEPLVVQYPDIITQLLEITVQPVKVTSLDELQSALTNGYKNIFIVSDFEIAKQVEVPEGVTIIGNGHTIRRADNFQTVNAYGHTATEMTMFNVQANFHIEDLTIDGNRDNCKDPSWELTHEITLRGNALVNNINIINGNECIIAFGDDNVIQNSTFTNCSGNAIHFSGGKRTRLLNNTIKNTNLDSINGVDLGHKGGCVSWSAECEDVTAIGNWLENGYCGFGFIGGEDNSRLKIIGNTVKNCERAIEGIFTELNPVKDIVIQSNHFIDSASVSFSNTDNAIPAKINGIIEGNNFKNTAINLDNVAGFVVTNNILDEKTELAPTCISCQNVSRVTISNNHCSTQSNIGIGIYLSASTNVMVSHNYVRAGRYSIYANVTCSHIIIDGNTCRMIYYSNRLNEYFLPVDAKNVNIINNEIVTYARGCNVPSYATVLNNRLIMIDTSKPSFSVGDDKTNIISKNNRTNGTFWTTPNAEKKIKVEDNDAGAFDDVFVNLTMNLTNITSSDIPTKVTKGDEFVFTLIADEGHSLPENITITNNGINCIISDFEYDKTTGIVTIYSVVGDVVVTAQGV